MNEDLPVLGTEPEQTRNCLVWQADVSELGGLQIWLPSEIANRLQTTWRNLNSFEATARVSARVNDKTEIKLEGLDRMAGRDVYILSVEPSTGDRSFGQQMMWVDQQTFLPLRMVLHDVQGNTFFAADYESFKEQPSILADAFTVAAPADAQVFEPDLKTVTVALNFGDVTLGVNVVAWTAGETSIAAISNQPRTELVDFASIIK